MNVLGKTKYVSELYRFAVIEHGFSAHSSENLMLVGTDKFNVQLRGAVKNGGKFRLKASVA